MNIFRLFLLILSCVFFPICCNSKDVNGRIQDLMDDYKCVGLSVVVVKDNKIVYYNSYGYNPDYSDSLKRTKIKRTDVNYIASISKTFISTAIMQLKDNGKLSLDDDVNNYLDFCVRNPYYSNIPITIRMLLTHRSSLNNLNGAINFDHFNLLIPNKNRDYAKCYNNYQPGAGYDYCNYGYVILGAIIEKASGENLDNYVKSHILRPMGLYGGFDVRKLNNKRLVRSLRNIDGKFEKQPEMYLADNDLNDYVLGYSTPALHPADGMIISSCDLAKFMIMHMNDGQYKGKTIISKTSEQEMRKIPEGNKSYGFALSHYDNIIDGVEMIGMTGGSRGMHTAMYFNPQDKSGFVVFCNGCKSNKAYDSGIIEHVIKEMYCSVFQH